MILSKGSVGKPICDGFAARVDQARRCSVTLQPIRAMWTTIRHVIAQRKTLRSAERLRRQRQAAQAIALLERHAKTMEQQPEAEQPLHMTGRAVCLGQLGRLYHGAGDGTRARALCESALDLCILGGDRKGVVTYATNLCGTARNDEEAAAFAALVWAAKSLRDFTNLPAAVNHVAAKFLAEDKADRGLATARLAQELACLLVNAADPPSLGRQSRFGTPSGAVDRQGLAYRPWQVEIRKRQEGYRELRCLPARWACAAKPSFESLMAESLSGYVQLDRDHDFWSASDAALRLRDLTPAELGLRELAVMATRRATDYNAPRPWAASHQASRLSADWKASSDPHVHPLVSRQDVAATDLWNQYGMAASRFSQSDTYQVSTGYYVTASLRSATAHRPWNGGSGTYYTWETLLHWPRWPRRQVGAELATTPDPGKLLLFISHRWEGLDHPDPEGRQLLALRVGLALSLAAALRIIPKAQTESGLPEVLRRFLSEAMPETLTDHDLVAWAAEVVREATAVQDEEDLWARLQQMDQGPVGPRLAAVRRSVLVWYDYASMNQAPRSPAEEAQFRCELRMLNEIQASAATVVISTDEEYARRAWCFLEIAGGLRHTIVELMPSWGTATRLYSSLNRWAHISDQLIASLVGNGLDSIEGSELRATDAADLGIIAQLISQLPLVGLVESDGSDLVAGPIPMPFRSGRWIVDAASTAPTTTDVTLPARHDFGVVPPLASLQQALQSVSDTERLAGPSGLWIYTTQRLLSLSWAARASELCVDLAQQAEVASPASVICTWADSRALGDDGSNWTRYLPSDVKTLIIMTQADLPKICRIYEAVAQAHLAAGVRVITYSPEIGIVRIAEPASNATPPVGRVADAMVVPRVRRTTLQPAYLLASPALRPDQIEVMAALRLDPTDKDLCDLQVESRDLAAASHCRVIVEGLARTMASCWEVFAPTHFTAFAWRDPAATCAQLAVIERLIDRACAMSDNPLQRRAWLYRLLYGKREAPEVMEFPLPQLEDNQP
jgi:hypothetical protein